MSLFLLSLCAFFAGLVDAAVGGGGLIQLPALLVLLPAPLASSIPAVFGTNKGSSICGTSVAVLQYSRHVQIPWGTILPASLAAFLFSMLGASLVSHLATAILKPLVLVLLVAVMAYTAWRRNLGALHKPKHAPGHERLWAIGIGAAIGFYDGFFGPGTGSFLIFLFVGWLGFDFLVSTASAKVVNFATNLSAVGYFAWHGNIYLEYALPMGLCNILGSMVGARLAILKGNRFLRWFFLAIVAILIARLGYDVLK